MQKLYKRSLGLTRELGVTLIELLVAMMISLFMIGAVLYVVNESQITYRHNDSLGRIQEGGRIAIELVAYDSRMAGYFGCIPQIQDAAVVTALPPPTPNLAVPLFRTIQPVTGMVFPSPMAAYYVNEGTHTGVPGTDVLLVRKGSNSPQNLVSDMATPADPLVIANNPDQIQVGDLVVISDCSAADVFRATAVGPGAGGVVIGHAAGAMNRSGQLSKVYGQNAQVMRFSQDVYYLRDSGRTMPDGSQIISLYRRNGSNPAAVGPSEELIEGVTNMVVTYGVDTNTDQQIDQYVAAAAIPPLADVLSARVEVLVAGTHNQPYRLQPYFFNNAVVTPTDGILRQSFSATAAFRNRLQ